MRATAIRISLILLARAVLGQGVTSPQIVNVSQVVSTSGYFFSGCPQSSTGSYQAYSYPQYDQNGNQLPSASPQLSIFQLADTGIWISPDGSTLNILTGTGSVVSVTAAGASDTVTVWRMGYGQPMLSVSSPASVTAFKEQPAYSGTGPSGGRVGGWAIGVNAGCTGKPDAVVSLANGIFTMQTVNLLAGGPTARCCPA